MVRHDVHKNADSVTLNAVVDPERTKHLDFAGIWLSVAGSRFPVTRREIRTDGKYLFDFDENLYINTVFNYNNLKK